jgi:hypothetical protein
MKPQQIMETLAGAYRFKEDPKTKAKYGSPEQTLVLTCFPTALAIHSIGK